MRFFFQFVLTLLLALLLELFLPWYFVALAAFIAAYLLPSKANFLAGFLGVGLLWLAEAWLIDAASATHLAAKVAMIFPLGKTYLLFLVTMAIGGLVGGFAAMAGGALKGEKKKYY